MQAIRVQFLGPTNSRGARFKATAAAGSVTVPYDYSLNHDERELAAAQALAAKFGWTGDGYGELVGGGLADGSSVFVFVRRAPLTTEN